MRMNVSKSVSIECWAMAIICCSFFGVFAAVASSAFTDNMYIWGLTTLVTVTVLAPYLAKRLPKGFDGAFSTKRMLCIIWLLLSLTALLRTSGVALYMASPETPQASAMWFDDFYVNHSCLSAYWKGGEVATSGLDNIYEDVHYEGFEGRFKLDGYLYPPQFLLLPKVALALGTDFLQMRALWFALEASSLGIIMLLLANWIGGTAGRISALLSPLVWLGSPALVTLQTGNFHLAAIAMAVMAMVLFAREKTLTGSALLGFAMFKIFPGILCGYLLFTKKWKPLIYTIAFTIGYSLIALVIFGSKPFIDFVYYELPLMASGEVWSFLEIPALEGVVSMNNSIPGIVLKLKVMGLSGMDMALVSKVAWIWTVIVVGLTFYAAKQSSSMSRLEQAQVWIALLSFSALRSPFVPDDYGLFPALWLLTLLGATWVANQRYLLLLALWVPLSIVVPWSLIEPADTFLLLAFSTSSQFLAIGLFFWVLFKRKSLATQISKSSSRHYNNKTFIHEPTGL